MREVARGSVSSELLAWWCKCGTGSSFWEVTGKFVVQIRTKSRTGNSNVREVASWSSEPHVPSGTQCGETTSVMSLCDAVLPDLGGRCVCPAPCHGEREARVCKRSLSLVSRMSGGFLEECPTRVSNKNVLASQPSHKCQARVSCKSAPQGCLTRVSHNTVQHKCCT